MDPAIWFPEVSPPYSADLMALPRSICTGCPVRSECLDYAIRHDIDGIWAATDPKTRRRIRRSLAIPDPARTGDPARRDEERTGATPPCRSLT